MISIKAQGLIISKVMRRPDLSSADFFPKLTFSKNSFSGIPSVSNSLNLDQAQHFVGPDLGSKMFAKIISR